MTIRLLGTGAADGIPGFFVDNEVSRWARENGGKDIRTRSGAVVDGVLKIDFPPDTFHQAVRDRLNPRDWTGVVFTHSHEDHLAVAEIQYALFPFTDRDHLGLSLYGNAQVCSKFRERYPDWPMDLVETHSFVPYNHASYTITPIQARHKEDEDCQNLIIQRDDKTLLYATDTGLWSHETFEFLTQFKLDLLVIECTDGLRKGTYAGHLDLEACVEVVDALRQTGVLDRSSRVVTTHHASTGGARHCDLERALGKHNIQPGYDGMTIRI